MQSFPDPTLFFFVSIPASVHPVSSATRIVSTAGGRGQAGGSRVSNFPRRLAPRVSISFLFLRGFLPTCLIEKRKLIDGLPKKQPTVIAHGTYSRTATKATRNRNDIPGPRPMERRRHTKPVHSYPEEIITSHRVKTTRAERQPVPFVPCDPQFSIDDRKAIPGLYPGTHMLEFCI